MDAVEANIEEIVDILMEWAPLEKKRRLREAIHQLLANWRPTKDAEPQS